MIWWGAVSVTLAEFLLARTNWRMLLATLSYNYIVTSNNVAPWGVLALAALMLYLKRKQIRAAMDNRPAPVLVAAGLVIICLAFFIPFRQPFWLLRLLTASVGVFVVIFGSAAAIPLLLVGAYAFIIGYPLLVQSYLEAGYSDTAMAPSIWLLHLFGLHIVAAGQTLTFPLPSGMPMQVSVPSSCAGTVTMAVFVVIFTFMMLDLPLSRRQAIPVFLFGAVGTWLQNVIRIVLILCSGYFFGEDALWAVHFWTIYALFPLWYLLFALVYFRFAQKPPIPQPEERDNQADREQ
jgi:exosortase/archaeosortase family protein